MTINERLQELERLNQEMLLLNTLEQHLEEYGEYLLQKNTELSKQKEYLLSSGQLEKFQKYINREYKKSQPHRKSRWAGRIAVAMVALIVIMVVMVCSVGAFRRIAIDLLIGMDDSYGTIQTYEEIVGDIMIYLPAYIPDGYSQSNFQISSGGIVTIEYINNRSQIYFTQQHGTSGGVVDSENIKIEIVQINESEGKLIETENGYTLIWIIGDYTFTLYSQVKDDLIQIAQSVEI